MPLRKGTSTSCLQTGSALESIFINCWAHPEPREHQPEVHLQACTCLLLSISISEFHPSHSLALHCLLRLPITSSPRLLSREVPTAFMSSAHVPS